MSSDPGAGEQQQPGWSYLGETGGGGVMFITPPGTEPPEVVPLPCPCGQVHGFGTATRIAYENVKAGLGQTVLIATTEGAWHVPRIFLAAHGVNPGQLPALAGRYGFQEARL